jgi:hypothetical protein
MNTEIALFVLSGVFVVLWWLLRNWVSNLEKRIDEALKRIDEAFRLHQVDADRLRDLEISIPEKHYIKPELDEKFRGLEGAFREGTKELSAKFDNLIAALLKPRNGV